jgi:hypothetical protein
MISSNATDIFAYPRLNTADLEYILQWNRQSAVEKPTGIWQARRPEESWFDPRQVYECVPSSPCLQRPERFCSRASPLTHSC